MPQSELAFPASSPSLPESDPRYTGGGLTWRDYAAIHIVASYASDINLALTEDAAARLAKEAYALADALHAEKVRRG